MKMRFVLVRPEHDMNVGAVCRAIKNFGFAELWLVDPQCKLGLEAKKYAKHSEEVLQNARKAGSLKEAVAGCDAAVGTTGVPVRLCSEAISSCCRSSIISRSLMSASSGLWISSAMT